MTTSDLADRQRLEMQHWIQSATEGPDSDLVLNFLKKAGDARILLDLIGRYRRFSKVPIRFWSSVPGRVGRRSRQTGLP